MHKTNQEIGNTMEYFNVGTNVNRVTRFTLHKDITYFKEKSAIKCYERLNELKKHKFDRVLIPPFEAKLEYKTVYIEMEFIKGNHLYRNQMHIVYEDCVLKEGEFGITNFTHRNFIREDETDKIYYIDLEDVGELSMPKRIKLFKNSYRNTPHVEFP